LRRPWIWWLAVLVPLWIVLILCAHWEPVQRDGWGHVDWHRAHSVGLGALWDELVWGWKYNNPRPGQILTLLAYTPGPWHEVFTPLAELGLFALLAALVLGRWPSVRRGDDLLLFVAIVGLVGVCSPQFGPMLFYRPIAGNYTHTFALNLLWLVPYRFAVERAAPQRLWLAPVMVGLGFVAGFCNEHTGPAFVALAALATVVCWRRDGARIWMIAGIAGFLAGFALLILAPGQSQRYEGLAEQASIMQRIAERGLLENVRLVGRPLLAMWPALPAIALGIAATRIAKPAPIPRQQRLVLLALVAAGVVAALTVLASPKIGHRLFFATSALWCAALAGWLTSRLTGRLRIGGGALLAGVFCLVLVVLVIVYRAVGPVGEARLAAITEAAPGSTVYLQRYPVGVGRWFLGEDLDAPELRAGLAGSYGLAAIVLSD
jgi:hypothetical protein